MVTPGKLGSVGTCNCGIREGSRVRCLKGSTLTPMLSHWLEAPFKTDMWVLSPPLMNALKRIYSGYLLKCKALERNDDKMRDLMDRDSDSDKLISFLVDSRLDRILGSCVS